MKQLDVAAVGKRVKKKREANGLTQEKLAYEVGITGRHLYDIERGKRVMSVTILYDIKEVFDVTADWLLEGDEEAYNDKQCVSG